VAVSSRGFASAAAEGLRTPPALETETMDGEEVVVAGLAGVVGAAVIDGSTAVVVVDS